MTSGWKTAVSASLDDTDEDARATRSLKWKKCFFADLSNMLCILLLEFLCKLYYCTYFGALILRWKILLLNGNSMLFRVVAEWQGVLLHLQCNLKKSLPRYQKPILESFEANNIPIFWIFIAIWIDSN